MKLKELHESAGKSVADLKMKYFEGRFDCTEKGLTSLVGSPKEVSGSFSCSNNKLTSLDGAPSRITGFFYGENNNLTSLEGIHLNIKYIRRYAYLTRNPIKSHVLGLLLIDGLEYVTLDYKKVQNIINKYLDGSRDVFECQQELMDAGLDEYAQL